MIAIVCWLLFGVVLVALGKLCDNMALLGIGAVMVLLLAMVSSVAW